MANNRTFKENEYLCKALYQLNLRGFVFNTNILLENLKIYIVAKFDLQKVTLTIIITFSVLEYG